MAPSQPMPLPEPMNASPHHSKVKVSMTFADPIFVAGDYVAGKMELECRADKGLGVGVILVELFAVQELNSRDHSATSTFLHSKRLFQGPGLPPSNAVHAYPQPGYPSLPPNYYQARRGLSTFLFRIPIPETSPSSVTFGSGLGKVRYELRASVGVVWKGERRLVIDNHTLDVISAFPHELVGVKEPEGVIIGENGKFWMHGKLVGPFVISGESACIELQVRNHSNKKNSGLSLSLIRTLVLPGSTGTGKQALELTDILTHVPFRGTEYVIPPGAEGVANLVFDVPRDSRGVRGGILDGDEGDGPRSTDSLFEIRCSVEIKMSMGFGNKDLVLTIPVVVVHPRTVPIDIQAPALQPIAYAPPPPNHYVNYPAYTPHAMTPPIHSLPPFMVDHQQNQVWLPPPTPVPFQVHGGYSMNPHQYLMSPAPQGLIPQNYNYGAYLNRPVSAGGNIALPDQFKLPAPGLPHPPTRSGDVPGLPSPTSVVGLGNTSVELDAEVGKGQRALRVSHHLRLSSRTRSVSPQSHRFPVGGASPREAFEQSTPLQGPVLGGVRHLPEPPQSPPALALDRLENLSLSPPQGRANTMVHSPRPQLTPKHSFYNERPKSERVQVLERMADVVVAQVMDLSGDIPKDEVLHASLPLSTQRVGEMPLAQARETDGNLELNKTLPAPPVPSGKTKVASKSVGSPLVNLFETGHTKSAPLLLPSDKAPPTPTLAAVLPRRFPRSNIKDFLTPAPENSASGLDALEKRLLAEVGTRKFDPFKPRKDDEWKRADVRSVMGVSPIDIPSKAKSPETLNDSAISSLTLANGLRSVDGDVVNDNEIANSLADQDLERADSDVDLEVEARTHRGGGSTSGDEQGRSKKKGSGDGVELFDEGLLGVQTRHKREEVDAVPLALTPTRLSVGSGKSREKRSTGKNKDRATKDERTRSKTEAKGRVAAWLGAISPDEPPQEESIPPSPSVARRAASVLREAAESGPMREEGQVVDANSPSTDDKLPPPPAQPVREEKDVSCAPNPRSSGFVPIHTLKRGTLFRHPVIEREMTVVEESRKVTNIWGEAKTPRPDAGLPSGSPMPKPFAAIATKPMPQSLRTDRAVSPPSRAVGDLLDNHVIEDGPTPKPIQPSKPTVARNVWRLPEPPPVPTPAPKAELPPKPTNIGRAKPKAHGRLPDFPPLPSRKPDPEISYDVRSARGGRGGRVASVTALWASVAANSGSGSGPPIKPKHDLGGQRRENKPVATPITTQPAPRLPGKVPLTGLMKHDASAKDSPKSPLRSEVAGGVEQGSTTPSKPALSYSEAVEKSESPRAPRKFVSAVNLSQLNAKGPPSKKEAEARTTPARGLFTGDPKARTPGKTTPNSLSTSSTGDPKPYKGLAAGAAGGRRNNAKPIIKSTSVPAVISSSHAIPVLSSTASLARPPGTNGGPRVTADPLNRRVVEKSKLDRQLMTPIAVVRVGTKGTSVPGISHLATSTTQSGGASASAPKSPPPDLAFGKARLRDLIKKYQS